MRRATVNTDRRLLRLKPAAHYLSVSPGTLRGIIQRGQLCVVKLDDNGRAPWLVDRADLDELIERRKATL